MASVSTEGPQLIPAMIPALMLFVAMGAWPFGYYQLLRFVVCGPGTYVGWLRNASPATDTTGLVHAVTVVGRKKQRCYS